MPLSVRRLLALLPLIVLLGAAPAPPGRIVSLNVCADQYLAVLADPGQIAALTIFSRDPRVSAIAARAARLPQTRGSAEDLLTLRPDVLLGDPYRLAQLEPLLAKRPVVAIGLKPADSYAEIKDQVRTVARAIGHPDRGEALIAAMDARLARLRHDAGRGRVAAYYQRRGYLTGTGTLVDELMRRVGLVNIAQRLGRPVLASVGIEELALARPDFLVVEEDSGRIVDQGTEMLHHPVLAAIPRLEIPQAWTVCGGPAYVWAAERLTRLLERTDKLRRR